MKKFVFILCLVFIASVAIATELSEKIKGLPNVVSVEELEVAPFFSEKYLVLVKQPVNHSDTSLGFFTQRVFVSHKAYTNPVIMVTEGYSADRAANKNHNNELCDILDANLIFIEHRYFSESTPNPVQWKYLTTKNAAEDHHVINTIFKTIYTGKWIATGISKGGQTAILYKAFYPDDVDVTVPYVAPVNFGVEDGRHEPFIANEISNKKNRRKIREFQLQMLIRRDSLRDDFEAYVRKNNYTFKTSLDTIYDLAILEYPFAFWQWGIDPKTIPANDASDEELFKHFIEAAAPDYWSNEGSKKYTSFYVQAAHELGYYGYDTEPFKEYLVMKDASGYMYSYFLKDMYKPRWRPTMEWANQMVQQQGNNMLFIYGEYDPWSAPAYVKGDRKDQVVIYKPKGSHSARIKNLPPRLKRKAIKTLKAWLEE